MKILLVYPQYPESFWSFKYALKFVGIKAAYPPLGLLTVATMLPDEWEKRLVDLNVRRLKDDDIKWADMVMLSAMAIQKESARDIIKRCKSLGKKIVAGGPLFTMEPDEFPDVDHLVLNEAEITLPVFLKDLIKETPQRMYTSKEMPQLVNTPLPQWDLIRLKDYATMSIQFSRGCPYDCEFCDITTLFGRRPRLKSAEQLLQELEALYLRGWRGTVFIVDDNFIGNKSRLKKTILPSMINWMEKRRHPFWFITETSIDLADDEELMTLMQKAGFNSVFIGIETPSEDSLRECNKFHNIKRDLLASVKKIQNFGFQVTGGFIVGFDSDTPSIFEKQISFIQQSGIVMAMVGLLQAPVGTKLFERLKREKRLLADVSFSGNNTALSMNFIPKMNLQTLLDGYRRVVDTIYSPAHYYERVLEFFKEFKPARTKNIKMLRLSHVKALFKSLLYLGMIEKGRRYYWSLLLKTLFRYPRFLPDAVSLAIFGLHFRKFFSNICNTHPRLQASK